MFYYNCNINLYRPFIKLSIGDSPEQDQPREICTDAANNVSELLRIFVNTYGLRRVGFMYTHCVMSATIIHLLNVAHPCTQTALSETYLCEAIRALYDMKTSFPVVERYLRLIRSLAIGWFPQGAPQVRILWPFISVLAILPSRESPTSPGSLISISYANSEETKADPINRQ
jgi:hypothetical protein